MGGSSENILIVSVRGWCLAMRSAGAATNVRILTARIRPMVEVPGDKIAVTATEPGDSKSEEREAGPSLPTSTTKQSAFVVDDRAGLLHVCSEYPLLNRLWKEYYADTVQLYIPT